ncbi:oxalate decarboxylase [Hysterangium stoloniferum]|nr:oxalate decarboxylase [Hysterangium stoloniferum]
MVKVDPTTPIIDSSTDTIGLGEPTFAAPTPNTTPPSSDANDSFFQKFQSEKPEPIRGSLGASILGPQNVALDRQSPDLLAPPSTDEGSVPNAKWPFSLSHNRLHSGGWAREQNPMAGVNMRLEAGAIRELHWHATAEWAYVLKGTTRITSVTPEGEHYEADVNPGDIWYFPPGIPHSLQATDSTAEGSEFLLVFDSGSFTEDNTFLLSDWIMHVPKELSTTSPLIRFGFSHAPPALPENEVSGPQGVPTPFTFPWSKAAVTPLVGGSVKVIDSTTFQVSKTIAAADVTVDVGGLRELHWHPTQDEWTYFISGQARVTIFAANGNARTFNYQAGDVGYVPVANGHYVENIGNETLHFLEIFKTDKFQDISLNQWLALTPPALVKAHLNIDDGTLALFNETKQVVV